MKKCKSFIAAATMSLALTVSSAWAMPLPLGTDISDRFHGTVHRNDLIATDETYNLPQTNVISFEAGSYSGWHVHGEMTVIGIAGTGLYQEWGKEAVLIRPGDVVNIPAGVPHFHGAAKDAPFQQFVIYDSTWKAPEGHAAHTGALTEEQYEEANENAAPSAMQNNDSEFLFGAGMTELTTPNFNSAVYLRKILGTPNAANSPEWVYVAFPAGRTTAGTVTKRGRCSL